MGLFGWFMNKQVIPDMTPAHVVDNSSRPAAQPPPQEADVTADHAFGGTVAVGLTRYLQGRAQDMRTAGDKQYLSLLLRAVRNDGVEIPAMPTDLMDIQRLLSSPDTEIADLAKAVQRDASIAAKFVSVANSPLYRGIREVASVREALVRIGLNHSGMILLAIITSSKLFKVPGHETEARWLHAHSLSTAVICQFLARQAGENEESAFVAGLLHDLGRIFLLSTSQEVVRESRGDWTVSPDVLADLSGSVHAGFSALTAEAWNYRGSVVSAIQYHEVPEEHGAQLIAMAPPQHMTLIRLLALANLIDRHDPEQEVAQTIVELVNTLGLGDPQEVVESARATSGIFLRDVGVQSVAYPF